MTNVSERLTDALQNSAEKTTPPWSSKNKYAILLLIPSAVFLGAGLIGLSSFTTLAILCAILSPLLAFIFAIMAMLHFGGRTGYTADYIQWGIFWLLAHAGVLILVAFGVFVLMYDFLIPK